MKTVLRVAGLVILAAVLVWLAYLVWHTVGLVRNIRSGLALLEGGLEGIRLDEALPVLEEMEEHLFALRQGAIPLLPLSRLATGWPGIGLYARQVEPGLDFACDMVTAARSATEGLLPAWEALTIRDGSQPAISRLVSGLDEGNPYFYTAQAALGRAAKTRERLAWEVFPEPLAGTLQKIDQNFDLMVMGVDALIVLPELAGAHQEKTYLVAAMNDDELRGSGGFISGLGLLRVKDGDITHFKIYDSYILHNPDAQYPDPPGALKEYMALPFWLPRDANWSPDFPQSARDLQSLYYLTTLEDVDGVVAFDTRAVGAFLEVLGPLSIPGALSAVDAQTVQNWMRTAWGPTTGQEMSGEWWFGRKDFMADLAHAAIGRVQTLEDRKSLVDLGWAAYSALKRGDLLFYSATPDTQAVLERAELDGGVHSGEGDFVMLVDSNIGFNKVDARISRSVVYEADLRDPAHPRATFSATYHNPGVAPITCTHQALYGETYADMQNRCYWNAWRILAAEGSVLEKSETGSVPADWLMGGKGWDGAVEIGPGAGATTMFSGMMVLPNDGRQTNRLEWVLPEHVIAQKNAQWVYNLKIQKQAGASDLPFVVRVLTPPGIVLSSRTENFQEAGVGEWIWEGVLTESQTLTIVWQMDQ